MLVNRNENVREYQCSCPSGSLVRSLGYGTRVGTVELSGFAIAGNPPLSNQPSGGYVRGSTQESVARPAGLG